MQRLASLQRLRRVNHLQNRIISSKKFATEASQTDAVQEETQPFVAPVPLVPRLEKHYQNVLYEDLMLLTYEHQKDGPAELERLEEWNPKNLDMMEIFKMRLDDFPTLPNKSLSPFTELLLTPGKAVPETKKPRFRRVLPNPIDYTSVIKEVLYAKPDAPPPPPFSPLPSRMPRLKSIDLEIHAEDAIGNKSILLSAIMSLQSITGIRAEVVLATKGDHSKKIRTGMPIGAKVSLNTADSYHFLDKMIQCVLPRIREWEGVNPVGNGEGSISINLPASSIGTFPDIEPHFDSFPRLFDTKVTINTTAVSDWEAILLLSGYQLPFLPAKKEDEVHVVVSDDPWAAIKAAKTREERKALFAAMQEAQRQKRVEKENADE